MKKARGAFSFWGKIGIVVVLIILVLLVCFFFGRGGCIKTPGPEVAEKNTTDATAELIEKVDSLRAEIEELKKKEPAAPIVVVKNYPRVVIREEIREEPPVEEHEPIVPPDSDTTETEVVDTNIYKVMRTNVIRVTGEVVYLSSAKRFFDKPMDGDIDILHDANGWGYSAEPESKDRLTKNNGYFSIPLSTIRDRIPITTRTDLQKRELKGYFFNFGFYRGIGNVSWAQVHLDPKNSNVVILPNTGGCLYIPAGE